MIVFNRTKLCSFLQVLFKGTSWIKLWSELSKEGEEGILKDACRKMEKSNVGIVQQVWMEDSIQD